LAPHDQCNCLFCNPSVVTLCPPSSSPSPEDFLMAHTFTKLLTHVIFSTKERRSLMDDELQMRLFPYLGGIVREMGGLPLTINGPSNHVHLLVQTKASVSIAKLVETVKSNSTGWVHREWKERGGNSPGRRDTGRSVWVQHRRRKSSHTLPVRGSIIERFHSRRSSFPSFRNTGLSMTSDTFGNEEILSPLPGLGLSSDPYPALAPQREKTRGSDGARIVPALRASERN
jgi:REP element-mobilizing transposase RayT